MNPDLHYNNIGQLLEKRPTTIGIIEQNGIPETTTNSQLDDLNSPDATLDTYSNVFSIFQSKNLRWHQNEKLAQMDQDARGQVFKANGDHYHYTVNMLWDSVSPTTQRDLFGAKFIKESGKVIPQSTVNTILNENSSGWHLLENAEDRVLHAGGIAQLANYHVQSVAYDEYKAVNKAIQSLYGAMLTGKNDSTGSHHGIPTKLTSIYGLTGNQVVTGAQRAIAETLMATSRNKIDVLGSDRLSSEMKEMFLNEAFKNRGTIQVDAALDRNTGNKWQLILREFEEQEDWFDFPNNYLPKEVLGELLINGEPVYIEWDDAIRMSLSNEIISGLHQIYELPGPRLPGGSTMWEDLLEWEAEYLGQGGQEPTKRNLSPQQFGGMFRGFILGSVQSFSKAQVDYVLRPMIEHFKMDQRGERYMADPTDDQIREYINGQLNKHGDVGAKIQEYFTLTGYGSEDFTQRPALERTARSFEQSIGF